MTKKQFIFRCYNCRGDTGFTLEVPDTHTATSNRTIQKMEECQYCHHTNIIDIPESWDPHRLVLEDEDNFLGYSEGIPLIQGKKL